MKGVYELKNINNKYIIIGIDKKYLSGRRRLNGTKKEVREIEKLGYDCLINIVKCTNCSITFVGINDGKAKIYTYNHKTSFKEMYKHFKREMNKIGVWN